MEEGVRLEVTLRSSGDRVEGTVTAAGRTVFFCGWLEMIGVIERALPLVDGTHQLRPGGGL